MLQLNSIFRDIERKLRLRCLSPEYEILLLIYEFGALSPSELLDRQSSASSTFYSALKRLQDKALICSERDPVDRRQTRYSLAEQTRKILDESQARVLAWISEKAGGGDRAMANP